MNTWYVQYGVINSHGVQINGKKLLWRNEICVRISSLVTCVPPISYTQFEMKDSDLISQWIQIHELKMIVMKCESD